MDETLAHFKSLVEIVARLRGPDGCPWDKEQTQQSLTQYIIEESFELVEAIESGQQSEIREELGDFLFQVLLQAQVAQDEGHFRLSDVLATLAEKMIRRHPHVFQANDCKTSIEEVWKNWHQLKAQEGGAKNKPIFNYPRNLPALQAALKIGKKTEGYKFDWADSQEVFAKVREEFLETEEALQSQIPAAIEHEIGDLLFSIAQLARHQGMDPEAILRSANRRFERRFNKVLELSQKDREEFAKLSVSEMEELWKAAKRQEKINQS